MFAKVFVVLALVCLAMAFDGSDNVGSLVPSRAVPFGRPVGYAAPVSAYQGDRYYGMPAAYNPYDATNYHNYYSNYNNYANPARFYPSYNY